MTAEHVRYLELGPVAELPDAAARVRRWLADEHPYAALLDIDTDAGVALVADTLPEAVTLGLSDAVRPGDLPRLSEVARQRGLALGEVRLERREAVAFKPSRAHLQVRDRIARHLHCSPWDIRLAVAEDSMGDPTAVVVTEYPHIGDSERTKTVWKDIAETVVGAQGWTSKVHPDGSVELRYGVPVSYPSALRVDPHDYLRQHINEQWALPFGVDGRGREVAWDLTRSPHSLVSGLTGSGKTITLFALAAAALSRGFKLAVVEVSKAGADFDDLRPFVEPGWWGCASKSDASTVIQNIYALKDERMKTIRAAGHKKLHSMSREEQERLGLSPVLLLIDEAASLLAAPPAVKGLPKDHPVAIANQQEQTDVALGGDAIRRISAELRAVGVHLCFATQTFETALLAPAGGGVLRANLPFRVLMGRSSTTQIGQALMRPQAATVAYEAAHGQAAAEDDASPDLFSQPQPGRGIVETDSATGGFQGVYAPEHEWVAALESLGVPKPGGAAPGDAATASADATDTGFPTAA